MSDSSLSVSLSLSVSRSPSLLQQSPDKENLLSVLGDDRKEEPVSGGRGGGQGPPSRTRTPKPCCARGPLLDNQHTLTVSLSPSLPLSLSLSYHPLSLSLSLSHTVLSLSLYCLFSQTLPDMLVSWKRTVIALNCFSHRKKKPRATADP